MKRTANKPNDKIGFRIDSEIKKNWKKTADEQGISLTQYIIQNVENSGSSFVVPKRVEKAFFELLGDDPIDNIISQFVSYVVLREGEEPGEFISFNYDEASRIFKFIYEYHREVMKKARDSY